MPTCIISNTDPIKPDEEVSNQTKHHQNHLYYLPFQQPDAAIAGGCRLVQPSRSKSKEGYAEKHPYRLSNRPIKWCFFSGGGASPICRLWWSYSFSPLSMFYMPRVARVQDNPASSRSEGILSDPTQTDCRLLNRISFDRVTKTQSSSQRCEHGLNLSPGCIAVNSMGTVTLSPSTSYI
jgi:hypothetical protein